MSPNPVFNIDIGSVYFTAENLSELLINATKALPYHGPIAGCLIRDQRETSQLVLAQIPGNVIYVI